MSLELIRLLVITPLLLLSGFIGGIYALKALALLHGNPEMMKTQREIWFPILTAGGLIMVASLAHVSEHFVEPSFSDVTNLFSEVFILIGHAFLVLGIYRYWRLQAEYNQLKSETQRKVSQFTASVKPWFTESCINPYTSA